MSARDRLIWHAAVIPEPELELLADLAAALARSYSRPSVPPAVAETAELRCARARENLGWAVLPEDQAADQLEANLDDVCPPGGAPQPRDTLPAGPILGPEDCPPGPSEP